MKIVIASRKGRWEIGAVDSFDHELFSQHYDNEVDFAVVKGQESVKRALEIAAAGNHNILTLLAIKPVAV